MHSTDFEAFNYADMNGRLVARHRHNFYEILFFHKGNVTYEIDDQSYVLQPGDIVLLPKEHPHNPIIRSGEPYIRSVIWVSEEYIRRIDPSASLLNIFNIKDKDGKTQHVMRLPVNKSGPLLLYAQNAADESVFNYPHAKLMQSSLIAYILVQLSRYAAVDDKNPEDDSICSKVKEYLDYHFTENISLDDLEEKFYVSKFHLSRVFKQQTGSSIHEYITKLRMTLARQLLYTDAPLNEIYQSCGYNSYSSFFRSFKARYGCSPNDFQTLQSEAFSKDDTEE